MVCRACQEAPSGACAEHAAEAVDCLEAIRAGVLRGRAALAEFGDRYPNEPEIVALRELVAKLGPIVDKKDPQ